MLIFFAMHTMTVYCCKLCLVCRCEFFFCEVTKCSDGPLCTGMSLSLLMSDFELSSSHITIVCNVMSASRISSYRVGMVA